MVRKSPPAKTSGVTRRPVTRSKLSEAKAAGDKKAGRTGAGGETAYVVGQLLPGWRGPVAEGGEFTIDSGGPRLRLAYHRPSEAEIHAFNTGQVKIGLLKAGPHTLFYLFAIAGCTVGWCDASYALGLVNPDYRQLPERSPDAGWLVFMYLHDSENGILHAIRIVTMTPAFSAVLDGLITDQRAGLADFTPDCHYQEIKLAYARWRFPADIAAHALIVEVAGKRFPRADDQHPDEQHPDDQLPDDQAESV